MASRLLALGLACVLGLSAATQGFAYQVFLAAGLTFPQGLGAPWLRLDLLAIYPPWAIVPWWLRWGAHAPRAFILPVVLGLVVMGLALYRGWPRRSHKEGEAHWATDAEWKDAGCLSQTGIVLGKLR